MPYTCDEHKVAYQSSKQWRGHWMSQHKDEKLPPVESVEVEESNVPSDFRQPPPPGEKPQKRQSDRDPQPQRRTVEMEEPGTRAATLFQTGPEDEEESGHLDILLQGIGVPLQQRAAIVIGFQSFSVLRQHPANLSNFIAAHISPKLRNLIPMVVHEMFPTGAGEGQEDLPLIYPGATPSSWLSPMPQQMFSPFTPHPFVQPGQFPLYYPFPPPVTPLAQKRKDEEAPEVAEMRKQLVDLTQQVQQERQEREREKREEEARRQQAETNARIEGLHKEFAQFMQTLQQQSQQAQVSTEASEAKRLSGEVAELREELKSERDAKLSQAIESLRQDLQQRVSQIEELRRQNETTQVGRTTEDILAQVAPVIMDKMDGAGEKIIGELKGIRESALSGRLPMLVGSAPPAISQTAMAQQIARQRLLEAQILAAANQSVPPGG